MVALLIAVGVMHFHFGLISNELATLLYSILGPSLAVTIRAGMKADTEEAVKKLRSRKSTEARMKFNELATELIKREKRKGRDMNITHATGLLRHIFDVAHEKPFSFLKLLVSECYKRNKK